MVALEVEAPIQNWCLIEDVEGMSMRVCSVLAMIVLECDKETGPRGLSIL